MSIDADWDLVTRYGRAFRDHFVFTDFDETWPGHRAHHFRGSRAVQPDVDVFIERNDVGYLTGMGHGSYETFTGYEDKPIWSASQDLTLLRGAIVHLLSCQTGALLGTSMVRQGALAFWGYTVNFTFYHKSSPPQELVQDKTAEAFLKMDCIIDRGVLSKKTATEIYDSITTYVAQVYSQLNYPLQRAVFLDNYVHLVCPVTVWGDANATL